MKRAAAQATNKKPSQESTREEEKEYTEADGSSRTLLSRKRTAAELEVKRHKDAAHEFIVSNLPPEPTSAQEVDHYIPNFLENAIFCGHLVTDLDSIAGSIGAAELYGE